MDFSIVNLMNQQKKSEISMAQLSIAWLLSKEHVSSAIVGASKTEHLEDSTQASHVNLDKDTLEKIEEIMDNEPQYKGDHERWSYKRITKILKDNNYRMLSIADRRRQTDKERDEKGI